ncbi:MAG: hypothetical protein ACR5K9_03900 [Wolbachia sp.]
MWDRFFKDVEFTLISKDKNISQEAVRNKLSQITTQRHVNVNESLAAGA